MIGQVTTQANIFVGEHVPFDLLLGRPWQRGNYISIDERSDGTYLLFKDPTSLDVHYELLVTPDGSNTDWNYDPATWMVTENFMITAPNDTPNAFPKSDAREAKEHAMEPTNVNNSISIIDVIQKPSTRLALHGNSSENGNNNPQYFISPKYERNGHEQGKFKNLCQRPIPRTSHKIFHDSSAPLRPDYRLDSAQIRYPESGKNRKAYYGNIKEKEFLGSRHGVSTEIFKWTGTIDNRKHPRFNSDFSEIYLPRNSAYAPHTYQGHQTIKETIRSNKNRINAPHGRNTIRSNQEPCQSKSRSPKNSDNRTNLCYVSNNAGYSTGKKKMGITPQPVIQKFQSKFLCDLPNKYYLNNHFTKLKDQVNNKKLRSQDDPHATPPRKESSKKIKGTKIWKNKGKIREAHGIIFDPTEDNSERKNPPIISKEATDIVLEETHRQAYKGAFSINTAAFWPKLLQLRIQHLYILLFCVFATLFALIFRPIMPNSSTNSAFTPPHAPTMHPVTVPASSEGNPINACIIAVMSAVDNYQHQSQVPGNFTAQSGASVQQHHNDTITMSPGFALVQFYHTLANTAFTIPMLVQTILVPPTPPNSPASSTTSGSSAFDPSIHYEFMGNWPEPISLLGEATHNLSMVMEQYLPAINADNQDWSSKAPMI